MIPILYDKNEIAFVSNGLGRLVDCVSCEVTEERNGVYECEFVYPMTGRFYQEMVENGGIISVIHDDAKDRQAFDIYKYSAPIDGLVTFNARHISYRLSGIPVGPFTAASCALALQGIKDNSIMPNPFTFWTDKVVSSTFTLDVPASARALLAGQQGSILDVYGKGEYKFNNFDVRLYVNRGVDSGVQIRYGKNLSNMTRENDKGDLYNAIAPYWKGESGVVTVPGYIVTAAGQTAQKCVPMDFSGEFSEEPTATQLQAAAENYLAENEPWAAFDNITVDFVQLWETEDYKDVAVLERCSLCDTVSVYFPALGVTNTHAKIIKVTYDVLRERYSSMELGSPQTTLSQAVLAPYQEAIDSIDEKASVSFLESAIEAATDLITGGLGGHVVIGRNADGEPNEILIMDTDDKATAVNVWRFNVNGLAHSHNGYNGPYSDIALTMDGKINADMITTGTLNAALATIINLSADSISGGTLTVGGINNQNGIIRILDPDGNVAGYITNSQFYSRETNGGILEEAYLSSGYLRLVTDRTRSLVLGRDRQGGGLINIFDAAGTARLIMFAQNNSLELRDANGDPVIAAGGSVLSFYEGSRIPGLALFPAGIAIRNEDGKPDFRIVRGITPDARNIELFYIDTDYHAAVKLGKTATGAHLQLYSPDNQHNITLDTLNGSTLQDTTVNGVLDVTPRRCEATLSAAGWYRAIVYNAYNTKSAQGASGEIVTIRIVYTSQVSVQHEISLFMTEGQVVFLNETSHGTNNLVDKIRYWHNGPNGYIDIHWTSTTPCYVNVSFDVASRNYAQERWVAGALTSVADLPGGTVLTEHAFTANTFYHDDNTTSGVRHAVDRRGDIVTVMIESAGTGTNCPAGQYTTVYTLPSELSPTAPVYTVVDAYGGNNIISGMIDTAGRIRLYPVLSSTNYYRFTLTYTIN